MKTAQEYIDWVVRQPDPYSHSVFDPEFQALPLEQQILVVRVLDGYGLRDAVEKYRKTLDAAPETP